MEILFTKYEATGNDFIVLDNRNGKYSSLEKVWNELCDRRKGVGADGILLLEKSTKADFKMRIINADGNEVDMCGNGLRAITLFAHQDLKLKKEFLYQVETAQGIYPVKELEGIVSVKMSEYYDVGKVNLAPYHVYLNKLYLNTGVPHCVFQVNQVENFNVLAEGRSIRQNKALFPQGTNVNFFQVLKDGNIFVRTYERGVENETLSCGTGVTASALACADFFGWKEVVRVHTLGGNLQVRFNEDRSAIFLEGPASKVFEGKLILN